MRCPRSVVLQKFRDRTARLYIIFIPSPYARGQSRLDPACPPAAEVTSKWNYLILEDNPSVILGKLDSEYPSLISSETASPETPNEYNAPPPHSGPSGLSRQSRKGTCLVIFSVMLIQRLATFRGYIISQTSAYSCLHIGWTSLKDRQLSRSCIPTLLLSPEQALSLNTYNPHQQGGKKTKNKKTLSTTKSL